MYKDQPFNKKVDHFMPANARRLEKSEKPKKGYVLWIVGIAIFVIFILVGLYSKLTITEYNISSAKLPPAFDGFKIALITDLHGYLIGERQSALIKAIESVSPDIIVLCGDIIDKKKASMDSVKYLLEGIKGMAPVYAVPGNHEFENPKIFTELLSLYSKYGVIFMNGNKEQISRDNQYITLYSSQLEGDGSGDFRITVRACPADADGYNVLLFHYGNKFETVSKNGYDLVLSGHTHGGIMRLFGVGIIKNDGGLFPKYSKGVFNENNTVMVVSAGVGNIAIPRFFNRRELVTVTLWCGEE